jgi:hypothetical protein
VALVQCNASFSYQTAGGPRTIAVGELLDESDPAVIARRAFFTPTAAQQAVSWDEMDQASVTAGLSSTYVRHLGPSNGTDDTSTIQSALTAARLAGRGRVIGMPGETYIITGEPVIGSGTTLDVRGCVLRRSAGSNLRLIRNHSSVTPLATATDTATTSGSAVVSTALGAVAVVGQVAVIAGAGGNGNGPLVGVVSATTATTITLRTLDYRQCQATATVSSATVSLYAVDSGITILGGWWDGGANTCPYPSGWIMIMSAQDVTIDIEMISATGYGRGVSLRAVSGYWVRVKDSNLAGPTVQVNGPSAWGRIDYVAGRSGDDQVAFTAGDYATEQPTAGDIIGVTIGTIDSSRTTAWNSLKFIAGAGWLIDGITVDGQVTGHILNGNPIWIGDDTASANTTGGTYGTIDLGNVNARCRSSSNAVVALFSPAIDRLTMKLYHSPQSGNGDVDTPVMVKGTSTATIRQLIINGGRVTDACSNIIKFNTATVTVGKIVLRDMFVSRASGAFDGIDTGAFAVNIGEILIENCDWNFAGTIAHRCVHIQQGTLGRLTFRGGNQINGNGMYKIETAATDGAKVVIDGTYLSGASRVSDSLANTTVTLLGPRISTVNEAFYVNGASIVLSGSVDGAAVVKQAASEAVRVVSPSISADISTLTPSNGDTCVNSNGALSCGAGLVVYSSAGTGSGWKHVYSGATY